MHKNNKLISKTYYVFEISILVFYVFSVLEIF